MILFRNYFVNTTGEIDVISIVHEIDCTVKEANVPQGLMTVIVPSPGAAVTIIEMLPDIVEQLKAAIRMLPGGEMETTNKRKEGITIAPRVAVAVLGKSLQVPINGGGLVLGPREEVVLIDMETSAKRREFCVQVMGETPEAEPAARGAVKARR